MSNIESEIDNIIAITTATINNNENVNVNSDNDNDNDNENENNDSTTNDDSTTTNDDTTLGIDSQNIEVFNIALQQYLKLDEEIKALLEAIKLRNKTKKNLADTIGTYLRANEIRKVNLGGSYKGKKLETKIAYSSKGFSKENVTKVLYDELKEEAEIFDKIMESISKTNVITEKWNIRIVNEKQIKSKIEKSKNKIDMAEELLNEE
jgi:hypothetical protein